MPGPGIRFVELARVLAQVHDVTISAPTGSSSVTDAPRVVPYEPDRARALRDLFAKADVVVAPPLPPALVGDAAQGGRAWIVDLHNPEPFEGLEEQRARPRIERKVRDVTRIDRIGFAVRRGTAFICGSERQRDMWLGFLAASRRLDSDQYESDPELRTLIDVVPFGIPAEPPRPSATPVARGSLFPKDARILAWNGGIWDWLDPLTVLRALAQLREDDPSWALVFNGAGRPSHRAAMGMAARAMALADDLGLTASGAVAFRPGWTPYEERASLCLEADIGVSAHSPTLEARFAHRARMLDFVWARLPILCTEGDEWADHVVREGLGEVVPPGDVEAFAAAARRIASRGRKAFEPALAAAAAGRTWDEAARPLLQLVERIPSRRRRSRELASLGFRLRYSAANAARRAAGR